LSASDRPSQRQPFVGRESELRQLESAFEMAAQGDGALILLVGEPGIGKTALSDQLCRFVSTAGGRSLVGTSSTNSCGIVCSLVSASKSVDLVSG
jgi:Cdc6-like AAA superfamily ATPase